MSLNPPLYIDATKFVDPAAPREVKNLRKGSSDVYRYLGTPVLLKKMYTWEDVNNGVAQAVSSFDYVMQQSEYWGDVLSHGVGFASVETQPGEWVGALDPNNNPDILTIVQADNPPYPWFAPAPKYRGYGPGFLTYAILPDRPEDQWKLTEQGALIRAQTATVQLPFYPPVGDNDILIVAELDRQGRITNTFDRYQLKQMSAITMHGIDRKGRRETNYGPLSANSNRFVIGYQGEVSKALITDTTIYSIECDR